MVQSFTKTDREVDFIPSNSQLKKKKNNWKVYSEEGISEVCRKPIS